MQLSEFKISKTKSRNKPYKLADGGGLFLLAKPNGSKLWQQKYRHLGKERLLSHRQYPDVTLAQARQKLHDTRALLTEGYEPATQKTIDQITAETQSRTTFKLVAEEYLGNSKERGGVPFPAINTTCTVFVAEDTSATGQCEGQIGQS